LAPPSFNLSSPANSTSSKDNTPTLTWTNSSDINFDNYTIKFSLYSNFSTINSTYSSLTNSFTNYTESLANSTYYWYVKIYDKANNFNTSDTFIYNVEEISTAGEPTTQFISSTVTQVGGTTKKPFTIDIITPGDITIYSNDTLLIPLIVTNPSNAITLRTILLNVSSNYSDVAPSLSLSQIPSLRPKEQRNVDLKIITHTEPGTYGITITASVISPNFVDTFRIFANLIEKDKEEKDPVRERLNFANKLFNGNPRCLDLSEYINQANIAIEQGKYDQALSLAENAITSCEKLISLQEPSVLKLPFNMDKFIDFNNIKSSKNLPIIIVEVIGSLIILIFIIKFFKKRKKPKNNAKKILNRF